MDKEEFKQVVEKLREVDDAIKDLSPEIKPFAIRLFENYILGVRDPNSVGEPKGKVNQLKPLDAGEFFRKYDMGTPAENTKLITAYLYNKYGLAPFTRNEVEKIAEKHGITIPRRVDMTITQAQSDGKYLFRKTSDGFVTIVNGEQYLQATYNVKKGTSSKPKVK